MDQRIEKITLMIEENLHRELSLAWLAQAVNLSPSRMRHMFKTEVGITPTQYMQRLRMQRAKELLESTFLQVKEVRCRVGVNDDSHFVQEFKRAYGQTPLRYRTCYLEFMSEHEEFESDSHFRI